MELSSNLPKSLRDVLACDPEVLGGALCFVGTRVPVTVFLDNLAEGMGLNEFLSEYPSVARAKLQPILDFQAEAVRVAVGLPRAG